MRVSYTGHTCPEPADDTNAEQSAGINDIPGERNQEEFARSWTGSGRWRSYGSLGVMTLSLSAAR